MKRQGAFRVKVTDKGGEGEEEITGCVESFVRSREVGFIERLGISVREEYAT